MELNLKKDSIGDVFCKEFNIYVKEDMYLVEDTANQLFKNYETAFEENVTPENIIKAMEFVKLFIAEISETCANTRKGYSADELSSLFEENFIKSVENIVYYRQLS